jgi:FkbM family methyltransferase
VKVRWQVERRLLRPFYAAILSSDGATFWSLLAPSSRKTNTASKSTLRLRPLGGRPLTIRKGSSDLTVVWDTFVGRYHRPTLGEVRPDSRLILDLGANIGVTAADLACRFPDSRVIAVELDSENAVLCRANTVAWCDRVKVIEAAVWPEPGQIRYTIERGHEYSASIDETGTKVARAVTISDLIQDDQIADYVKMDIEGAEREVLAAADQWCERVRAMKIEVHSPVTVDECIGALEPLGFTCWRDARHGACVVAVRAPGRRPRRHLR